MKRLYLALAIASAITFTGCGSKNAPEQPEYRYVSYECELSDDWFTYYEVSATYTDITGKELNLSMTKGKSITYSDYLPVDDPRLAKNFKINVTANVKKNVEYDSSTKADFSYTTAASVSKGTSKKSSVSEMKDGEKKKAVGAKVSEFVSAKPSYTILNFNYSSK